MRRDNRPGWAARAGAGSAGARREQPALLQRSSPAAAAAGLQLPRALAVDGTLFELAMLPALCGRGAAVIEGVLMEAGKRLGQTCGWRGGQGPAGAAGAQGSAAGGGEVEGGVEGRRGGVEGEERVVWRRTGDRAAGQTAVRPGRRRWPPRVLRRLPASLAAPRWWLRQTVSVAQGRRAAAHAAARAAQGIADPVWAPPPRAVASSRCSFPPRGQAAAGNIWRGRSSRAGTRCCLPLVGQQAELQFGNIGVPLPQQLPPLLRLGRLRGTFGQRQRLK